MLPDDDDEYYGERTQSLYVSRLAVLTILQFVRRPHAKTRVQYPLCLSDAAISTPSTSQDKGAIQPEAPKVRDPGDVWIQLPRALRPLAVATMQYLHRPQVKMKSHTR